MSQNKKRKRQRKQAATMIASRYKRAMAPLDAKARARLWDARGAGAVGCEGSAGKLEELVRAFYSGEVSHRGEKVEEEKERPAAKWRRALELEMKDVAAEPAAEWIRAKVEAAAVGAAGSECEELVRRRLVRRMQDEGLDAGICKSRWQNTSGIPSGNHEYIDVLIGETRYIVEINLTGEFEIARPTADYMELLSHLPKVFVGRPVTLEAVIKLMCLAAQDSIKKAGMHLAPWRRREYMHEKWFSDYQRYTKASAGYKAQQPCRANSVESTGGGKLVEGIFLRGM